MSPEDRMEGTLLNYGDGPRAIYEELKQRIIAGELEGGSELKIMPLASELGVSIVPVREAIRILAAEDLIVLRPRRSPVVAKVEQRDLIEINRIRGALEPVVLEDAVPRHTPDTLAGCESLLEQDRACGDLWEKVELNRRFHLALLAPSPFDRTISIISDQYVGLARLTHFRVMNEPGLIDQHHAEHEAILTAVTQADVTLAATLLREHIDRATGRARDLLDTSGAKRNERTPAADG
ncbi:MAG: GntR family transcriptional regulator [Rhodobacteraceae bacterium]|nr:GntR family transcriptional regulator [Paracoccaceae bacterium]MCY4139974.1 GntR family transcriptional regulator [Paracoccaceae bacterium]